MTLIGGVLPLCREAAVVFYSPSQLGKKGLNSKLLFFYEDSFGIK